LGCQCIFKDGILRASIIKYTSKRVVKVEANRGMTENQFIVCSRLIRSRNGAVQQAAKLILVHGANAEQARLLLGELHLTDQQISNAVRRFERAHSLILSAYGISQ
jgi:hypothetical protein